MEGAFNLDSDSQRKGRPQYCDAKGVLRLLEGVLPVPQASGVGAEGNELEISVDIRFQLEAELGERVQRIVSGDRVAIEMELEALEETLAAAEKVTPTRDSKLQKLLDQTLPARFNSGGTIVFTKYVDTLEYLEEHVRDEFGDRVSVHTLYGELGEAERNERFQEFADSERGVLIATDVISEGMNLACIRIVNVLQFQVFFIGIFTSYASNHYKTVPVNIALLID